MNSWNWKEHIALIVGGASTLIVVFRLLAISGFDVQTAYAVMQTTGTAAVLSGSLLSSLWAILALVVMASWVLLAAKDEDGTFGTFGSFCLFLLAGFAIPAFFLAAVIVFVPTVAGMLYLLIQWRRRKFTGRIGISELSGLRRFVTWTIALIVVASMINPSPWMPLERITIGASAQIYRGYVLRLDDTSLVLLDDHPRHAEYISVKDQRITRQICNKHKLTGIYPLLQQSLYVIIFNSDFKYPQCHRR